jgi:hypothetical protein
MNVVNVRKSTQFTRTSEGEYFSRLDLGMQLAQIIAADNSGSRTAVGVQSPAGYDPVFTCLFSLATLHPHERLSPFDHFRDTPMKRSRRVVLTMMGTAAIGAVSTGFVRRAPCGPGAVAVAIPGPDRGSVETCRVRYGGFGGAPHRLHGHGHFHGGS